MAVAARRIQPNVESFTSTAAHVESRVDGLERSVEGLSKRFESNFLALNGKIDASLADTNAKIEALTRAITLETAKPKFRIAEMLTIVVMCSSLLAFGGGSIIFVATAISSGPLAKMETRIENDREWRLRLERDFERYQDRQAKGTH
ncbi:MAG: hypothetical protein ACR2K1_08880 [Saprospiraceae bacterium]